MTEPNKGASVTVWGNGFGLLRGQNYISVNGVSLEEDSDYASWGETWPTPFYQKITFWLNNKMLQGSGEIRVTIDGKTSNSLPFTIRSGRIFFLESDNPGGDGSLENPFDFSDAKIGTQWLRNMQAGDIYYFKDTLEYTEKVNDGNSHMWLRSTDPSGNRANPIAFLAYPGHKPTVQVPTPYNINLGKMTDMSNNYAVLSGFTVNSPGYAADIRGNYHRVIGNDFMATSGSYSMGTGVINVGGDGHIVLGNNIHGMRSGDRFDHGIYINGCSPNEGIKLGWNYLHDNDFGRGPEIVINHEGNRCPSDVYLKSHFVFSNIVHCDLQRGMAIGVYNLSYTAGETEPEPTYVYNNLVVGCGTYDPLDNQVQWAPTLYHANGHARFYNNTLYDSGYLGLQNNYPLVLSTHFKNNIVHMNPNYSSNLGSFYFFTDGSNTHFSHNLYAGLNQDASCTECIEDGNHVLNQDPQFIDPGNYHFALQSTSPAIDMASSDLLFEVLPPDFASMNKDYYFMPRTEPFDIGAIETSDGQASYTINGEISGLAEDTYIVLQNNGIDNLTISSNGRFSFPNRLLDDETFEITVIAQPIEQICEISNGSGAIALADINHVSINCAKNTPPVVLFSDIETGPKSGWSAAEPHKGAAVTIWGYGFGSSRGTNYISVNGVNLQSDTDYALWGEYWPTPFHQRITFWLNNSMVEGPGEITLTVNGKTSMPLPFTIRSGRIRFIESDNPLGNGSVDDPFDFSDTNIGAAWLSNMLPGDIFYLKDTMPYTEIVNEGNSHLWLRDTNSSGTAENPIAFIAFPNHKPLLQVPLPYNVNFRKATDIRTNYNVFSGLTIDSPGYAADINGAYNRVVGNDFRATSNEGSQGTGIINVFGDGHIIIGNNVHGMRSGKAQDHAIYIQGCAANEGVKLGWNYLHDNDFGRGPEIYVYHSGDRCPADVVLKSHYIYNNVVHCDIQRGKAIGISDLSYDSGELEPQPTYVYNNLIVACGIYNENNNQVLAAPVLEQANGHARFYNNTLYDAGYVAFESSTNPLLLSSYFKNNIVYMNPNFSGSAENKYIVAGNNNYLSNNLYYGIGDYTPCVGCLEDKNNLSNRDPMFVDPLNFIFELQPGSPAVDVGLNNLLFENPPPSFAAIGKSISHVIRSGIFDLGSMELNDGLPAYTIGGNISGLAVGSSVLLQLNSVDELKIMENGQFNFVNPLIDGSVYQIEVISHPDTPKQVCSIRNGEQGMVSAANVTHVVILCMDPEIDSDHDGIPDVWDKTPENTDVNICSGEHAILQGVFSAGTQASCRANLSITIENIVVVEEDAFLSLTAPQINFEGGFSNQGRVKILPKEPMAP